VKGTRIKVPAEGREGAPVTLWERFLDRYTQPGAVQLVYSDGHQPARQNRRLTWKVPSVTTGMPPEKLDTEFKVLHNKNRWRVGGSLVLADSGRGTPDGRPRVHVTITIGTHAGAPTLEEEIMAGGDLVEFDTGEQSSEFLRVSIQRTDTSEGDVLLCWLRPGRPIQRLWAFRQS
jgi:hypothetical protein